MKRRNITLDEQSETLLTVVVECDERYNVSSFIRYAIHIAYNVWYDETRDRLKRENDDHHRSIERNDTFIDELFEHVS